MKNKAQELYEKAAIIINSTLGTAHIDIVDMCEKEYDHPRCLSCEHFIQSSRLGTFCSNEYGIYGSVSPLNDYCSKHKERT